MIGKAAFLLGLYTILFAGTLTRAFAVEATYSRLRDCSPCFFWYVIQHDLRLMGPVILLSSVLLARKFALRFVAAVIIAAFSLAYFTDVALFFELHQRLAFSNVLTFIHPRSWAVFLNAPQSPYEFLIFAAPLIVMMGLAWLVHRPVKSRWLLTANCISGIVLTIAGFLPNKLIDPISYQTHNFIELNRNRASMAPYSVEFAAALRSSDVIPSSTCNTTLISKRNVILLIIESLSSYQSKFFSGLSDLTPQLDALARDHTAYTNFHANSFASGAGRHSMFLSSLSIQSPYPVRLTESLFKIFKDSGYSTSTFFAARDSVEGFGDWMRSLRIDFLSTADDPFYRGKARHIFGSISDQLLYERSLKHIDQYKDGRPLFMTILTASTHQPFRNPDTNRKGIAAAFQYADDQIGRFVNALQARHFFDHGTLVITSDHHVMNPITSLERDHFGRHAAAMIPLIIIDSPDPQPKLIDLPFQQADLLNSFSYWLGGCELHPRGRGNLFTGEPPACIFHTNSDLDDTVDVFCGTESAVVLLDGDKTRIINGHISDEAAMLRQLNSERIGLIR